MLGSVVEGRADQLPTAQWLNHDSVVIPSGLWCCSPQTFPSGSLFFYLQFLKFWLRSKEIPSFLISLHFFLCFLLDFMSCNPNCEIYLITNSESLYKNPTFLYSSTKETKQIYSNENFEIIFLCTHVCMSTCVHTPAYHSLTCYHMYMFMLLSSHSGYTLVLCFNWLLWPLLLWRGHYLIS